MQANLQRKDLQAMVSTAIRFSSRVSTLPVLVMFKLEVSADDSTFRIHATNLERGIILKTPVVNSQPGAICIDAQKFTDFVTRFTGDSVQLDLNRDVLKISCGSSVVNLRGLDPDEFPAVAPQMSKADKFEDINVDELQAVSARVAFATAQEAKIRDARPNLSAVHFSGKVAEATDGFIMAVSTFGGLKDALISSESVVEAGKVFRNADSIKGFFGSGRAVLMSDWVLMVCNCIDLSYPKFDQILPKEHKIFVNIKKTELLSAISQAMIVAGDERVAKKIKLSLDDVLGICNISTHDDTSGDVSIDLSIELKGGPLEVFINGDYLKSAVERCALEDVTIKFIGWDKPVEISEAPDWRCVIMPMGKGWG